MENSATTKEATSAGSPNGDIESQERESERNSAIAAKREWIDTAPESPRNWPIWRKWWIICGLLFYTVIIFICETGFVIADAETEFGVDTELAVLAQSIFILGVAIGPMILGPLSSVYGRQPVYTSGIFLFAILQIPSALTPNFGGLIASRFFAGCFAGLPLSNVGASAADLFTTAHTSWAIALFSFCSQVLGK